MKAVLQIHNPIKPHRTTINSYSKKQRPLILIAENEEENQYRLKELLDLYNVCILEAKSGEDAIDLTVSERPDLVLINAELPRLDGYEATRLIRTIKSLDKMPIILLSRQTDRIYRKKAFAAGGNCFHIAPLDLERLDNIMENYLFGAI
ncbi:MAG: putative two-component hybrid sensor and regulator [Acidobacteria bacterium]|jgi:CheY-like chemotaxis protein|nr:putative two-component hybrid sensor and regulator [Acidobacteriota bacterium]